MTHTKARVGRFEVVKTLGQGGMAELLHAREGAGDASREVAIKRVLPALGARADIVTMFRDEARLAARMAHPNLVRATESGDHDGAPYYAMELVRGVDCAKLLTAARKNGGLPFDQATAIVIAAARGLHFAHQLCGDDGQSLEVVHRDISPSNVLVTFDGVVKVIDFGIAKAHGRETETRTGVLKGKTAYMAPEQCLGGEIDQRTDVFALGILLFELTTGTRLYKAKTDYELIKLAAFAQVPEPASRRAGVPAGLSAIILRALARKPDDRYDSAEALADELEGWAFAVGMDLASRSLARIVTRLFPSEAAEVVSDDAVTICDRLGTPLSEHTMLHALSSLPDCEKRPAPAGLLARARNTGLRHRVALAVGWAAALALLALIPG